MSLAIQSGLKVVRDTKLEYHPSHHVSVWTKLVIYTIFLLVVTGIIAYSWSHRFLVEAANAEQNLVQMDASGAEKAYNISQSKSWQESILPWKAKAYAVLLIDARDQNQLRITKELNTAITNTQKNISFGGPLSL